ncbi:cell division protein pelota related protein, partial [mine drainage metagenome]
TVRAGPEEVIGEHQSAIIKPGDILKVLKQSWIQSERKMVDESAEESSRTGAIFIAVDEDEANIFILRAYGIQGVGHIDSGKSGKYYDSTYSDQSFFREIAGSLKPLFSSGIPITILGPGFTRDNIIAYLKQQPEFSKLQISVHASSRTDEQAIYEYLGTEEARKTMENSRLSREKSSIDSFMNALKSGGLATYGFDEVLTAVESGAVSELLISEEKSREQSFRSLIEMAMKKGSKISILSSHSEPGITLKGFGGVSAILRYAIS